jgi:fatty acid amide hydrolase 2
MPRIGPNSLVSRFCQLGPTARHASDLWPLLSTLSGADGVDHVTRPEARANVDAADPIRVDVSGLKVYVFDEPFLPWPLRSRLHPEQRAAQRRAAAALADLGCSVVPIGRDALPESSLAFSIWAAMLGSAQEVPFAEIISEGAPTTLGLFASIKEALLCVLQGGSTHRHTLPALGLAIVERLEENLPSMRAAMKEKGAKLRARLDRLLGDGRSVMLCPSLLTPAPRHHENMLRFADTCQTGLFNVMQLPATAVPMGRTERGGGLPVGFQVVAGAAQDHVSIAVAMALEKAGVAKVVDVL